MKDGEVIVMWLFRKKRNLNDIPASELTDSNRSELIEQLESDRECVVYQIEELVREIGRESGKRSLCRRVRRLGKAPNDRISRK